MGVCTFGQPSAYQCKVFTTRGEADGTCDKTSCGFGLVWPALIVGAAAAKADVGDGKLGCNQYEIYFSRLDDVYTWQKHFFYSGTHANYKFTNVETGKVSDYYLHNNADEIRNRDGSCDVKVIDDQVSTLTMSSSP